jgi:hypothetical protein
MSSSESNPNEPGAPGPAPASPRSAVVWVVVTLALLTALVWGLTPARFSYKPAPLQPPAAGCPKIGGEFVPTDYTEVPGLKWEGLSAQQKNRVLLRLNMEPCSCGCNVSIASCLVNHPQCQTCKGLAEKILAEERNSQPASPGRN